MTRAQLTDREWEFIEPFLPIGAFGPYPQNLREQLEGVVWKFRSGAQRREMPERFGAITVNCLGPLTQTQEQHDDQGLGNLRPVLRQLAPCNRDHEVTVEAPTDTAAASRA